MIRLRDVEGWSAEEVADALEITDVNQRVLLHRARSKVRAALEGYLGRRAGDDMSVELDDITCRELVELVTDYLEGALAPADRARFEEHLEICDACVAYVEQIRDDDRRRRRDQRRSSSTRRPGTSCSPPFATGTAAPEPLAQRLRSARFGWNPGTVLPSGGIGFRFRIRARWTTLWAIQLAVLLV